LMIVSCIVTVTVSFSISFVQDVSGAVVDTQKHISAKQDPKNVLRIFINKVEL
jgi:hypothetical protein